MDWVTISNWYWAAWLLVGFGGYEAWALVNEVPGDTLSERVRCWFATDIRGRVDTGFWGKIRRIALVLGLTWLAFHWLNDGSFF